MGDDFGAFGGWVNSVALDGAWDVHEIPVDHGYERSVVLAGQLGKDVIELTDVVGAVVGRQGNAGKEYFDVRLHEGS